MSLVRLAAAWYLEQSLSALNRSRSELTWFFLWPLEAPPAPLPANLLMTMLQADVLFNG